MVYEKRFDGRAFDELRPITAKVGVIPNANGSAMFKIGKTWAFAAVYGPKNVNRFLQDRNKGILRANYNMLPFSGVGERIRPGIRRRSIELGLVTTRALEPVVMLEEFPNNVVDIYVELAQADAGSRAAGICAASMALADAGIPMKDLVGAIAVGKVDGSLVVDLTYDEEAYEDGEVADIPIAMTGNSGEITLFQMDGFIEEQDLPQLLSLARKAISKIIDIQRKALKEKYNNKVM